MIHSHKYLTEILYILGFFFLATFYKLFFRSSRPEVFCKKSVLGNFAKFAGKHLCQSLFLNKVAGLRHGCFPDNFAKFLRKPFSQNTSELLLLKVYLSIKEFSYPVYFHLETVYGLKTRLQFFFVILGKFQ